MRTSKQKVSVNAYSVCHCGEIKKSFTAYAKIERFSNNLSAGNDQADTFPKEIKDEGFLILPALWIRLGHYRILMEQTTNFVPTKLCNHEST